MHVLLLISPFCTVATPSAFNSVACTFVSCLFSKYSILSTQLTGDVVLIATGTEVSRASLLSIALSAVRPVFACNYMIVLTLR